MKKIACVAVLFCSIATAGVVHGATATLKGMISDSQCGASHEAMRQKGQKVTDRECTVACVNYQTPGAPKFVFVSGGKIYPIKNQAFGGLGRRSGSQIMVTGDLDDKGEITISKIEAVPEKK